MQSSGLERPKPLVLLVDDEEEFATVMSKRLSKRGFHVFTAHSGTEAVRLARGQDFEVAVLDLKMEGMDGVETMKTLKVLLPDIKVIMLTGHGSVEMARQCLSLGAFDYLNKPCELAELVQKIQSALERAGR